MSKHQEALNKVYELISDLDFSSQLKCAEQLKTLQKAVDKANKYDEKETPKKVLNTELHHIDMIMKKFKCPECKMYSYNFRYSEPKYCEYCGQRLDWSEEDDK